MQDPQQQQGALASTASGQLGATEQSPLLFVSCSSCRRSFDPARGPQFFLTTCSHTVCDACTFPNQPPPEEMDNSLVDCPECNTRGPILRLVEGADMQGLAPCFRPLSTLLDELGMAVRWQAGNLVEQLSFFQAKCAEQRTTLSRLGSELRKSKALKSLVTELTAENTSLRAENANLKAQLAGNAQARVESRSARGQGQPTDARSFHSDPGSFGAGASSSRKRAADDDARERNNGARQAPLNSRSSSSAAARDLPVQPARLSLTPAHARDHNVRKQQGQALRMDASGFDVDGGRASTVGRQDQRAPRDKLGDYAYDPTRSYSKPPSRQEPSRLGDPSRPSSSRPSSSHRAFAPAVSSQEQYFQAPQQHDAQAHFQPPRLGFHSTTSQDEQPAFYYSAQQEFSNEHSNGRSSFPPPSRGITPMPSRFGGSQAAPQHYAPPPTPQRQPFQPLQPQQQFDVSRAAAGTPRPGSSAFVFRDPGGSSSEGFVSANHLR